MKDLVDSFAPAGNTNQGTGIAMAGCRWSAAAPTRHRLRKATKAILLMSDGLNTQNRWYSNQSQIDAREALTCTNLKAAGVVIYTVQVNTGGDAPSTVLQNCASSADKFTEIKTANQLLSTFKSIGIALSNLRIAQ
jgi:hypothetical protein